MANESVYKYGTTVTLANANGGATSTLQLSAAAATTYSSTNTADYPDAVFVLTTNGFGGVPVASTTIDLFIRALDVDGTLDAPAPGTGASTDAYRTQYFGSFVLKASSGADSYRFVAYDIPRNGEVYLYNGTAQTLTSGWTLKMTPRTIGPA